MPCLIHDRRAPSQRGFTLVELLVVISIIALLVSILLPTLSAARDAARQTLCKSRMRQLLIGIQMYAHDHESTAPPAFVTFGTLNWKGTTRTNVTVPWWSEVFAGHYFGNEHIGSTAYSSSQQTSSTEVSYCPAQPSDLVLNEPTHFRNMGIGYNTVPNNEFSRDTAEDIVPYTEGFVAPSRTLVLTDTYKNGFTTLVRFTGSTASDPITYRHSDAVNTAFADGHVDATLDLAGAAADQRIRVDATD